MGFPYPHYDAELFLGVMASCLLLVVALPAYGVLPRWAGLPLAASPLACLLATCAWVGYRRWRGEPPGT